MRTNNDIAIHKIFFEHCRSGIRQAMQLLATKESLNAADVQALRILGDVYEAMIDPVLEKCGPILERKEKMRSWLKEIRKQKGMTMQKVALASGISLVYYDKIENGTRNVPVKTAKRIAEALGFPWQKFFE